MIKTVLAAVFGLVVIGIAVYGIQFIEESSAAFGPDGERISISGLYFVAMLIGAAASERYKYFVAHPGAGRGFWDGISYAHLYKSLLVSPLVFGAASTYIGKDANLVMSCIFSFQNGFFWETIFGDNFGRAINRPRGTRHSTESSHSAEVDV
jgi:hypothetical protein